MTQLSFKGHNDVPESADGTGPAPTEPLGGVEEWTESLYQEQEGASGWCRLDQQLGARES